MGWAAAGLVISAYGTSESIRQGKAAADAQKKMGELQQRQADIATYRERIQAVRQARTQRAAIEQQAQAQGVAGSSSATGATSSIASQQAANLSFLDQTQALSRQTSIFAQKAATAQSEAATAKAIGNIGGSIFEAKGGWKSIL